MSRRVLWIAGSGLFVLVLVATVLVLSWHRGRQLPPTRAREYRAVDSCLLTGPGGIVDPQVVPVWAGMQDASLATSTRVSYLPVVGPETEANAVPFVESLVQRRCRVIVAVGGAEVGAAAKQAPQHGDITFVLLDGSGGGSNVSVVKAGRAGDVRPEVAKLLQRALPAR